MQGFVSESRYVDRREDIALSLLTLISIREINWLMKRKRSRRLEPESDTRHKDVDWKLPGNGDGIATDEALLAVAMDIRDALKEISRKLDRKGRES